jgi:hypothetical protein
MIFLPVVYVIMVAKTKESNTRVFQNLKLALNKVGPAYFSCDYEMAVISSAKEVFPSVTISGCLFHLSHSLFCVLQGAGLQATYQDQEEKLRSDFRKIIALAFVPTEDVERLFYLVQDDADTHLDTDPYWEYMEILFRASSIAFCSAKYSDQ